MLHCECNRPENCDHWKTELLPAAMFPPVVVWSVSTPLCSDPESEPGPEDLHVLPRHDDRNSSVEWRCKIDIIIVIMLLKVLSLFVLNVADQRNMLPGKSEWTGIQDFSGLLWFCYQPQLTGTGNRLKGEKIMWVHARKNIKQIKDGVSICRRWTVCPTQQVRSNLICWCDLGRVLGPQLFWSIQMSLSSGSGHKIPPQSRTFYILSLQEKTHSHFHWLLFQSCSFVSHPEM